jgi:hypothetical protein
MSKDCEFISGCEDIDKLKQSDKLGKTDDSLADQFYEVCTNGVALESESLRCCLRNKYKGDVV